jgi:hypothetical protein
VRRIRPPLRCSAIPAVDAATFHEGRARLAAGAAVRWRLRAKRHANVTKASAKAQALASTLALARKEQLMAIRTVLDHWNVKSHEPGARFARVSTIARPVGESELATFLRSARCG